MIEDERETGSEWDLPIPESEAPLTASALAEAAAKHADNLRNSVSTYEAEYFGRDLDPFEIDSALNVVSMMQASALNLLVGWSKTMVQLGLAGNGSTRQEVVEAEDLIKHGGTILRGTGVALALAMHLSRECTRLYRSDLIPVDKSDAASDAVGTLDRLIRAVELDVRIFEGRSSILYMSEQATAMEVQTTLNQQVTRLTKWTTALTAVILVATVGAGLLTMIGIFA